MYQNIAIIFAFHILFFRLIEFYLFFLSFDVFFLNQCTIYYTINISHDCIFHVQLLTEKHFCNDLAKIWISAPLRVCLYNCMFLYDIRHWFFFYIYIVKAVFLPNVICLQQDTCKFKPELNLSDLQLQVWQNVYDLDLKKKIIYDLDQIKNRINIYISTIGFLLVVLSWLYPWITYRICCAGPRFSGSCHGFLRPL